MPLQARCAACPPAAICCPAWWTCMCTRRSGRKTARRWMCRWKSGCRTTPSRWRRATATRRSHSACTTWSCPRCWPTAPPPPCTLAAWTTPATRCWPSAAWPTASAPWWARWPWTSPRSARRTTRTPAPPRPWPIPKPSWTGCAATRTTPTSACCPSSRRALSRRARTNYCKAWATWPNAPAPMCKRIARKATGPTAMCWSAPAPPTPTRCTALAC